MVTSAEGGARSSGGEVSANFPGVFAFLFDDQYRYKILYGGRGGGRSWAVARWLLIEGARRKLFVLCCREFQRSIAESVHRLLSEQIEALGLSSFYRVERSRITGVNGTEFVFAGLKHDPASLKSYEGVQVVWAEEAVNISRNSWNLLLPTVRAPGSQIVITFNPVLETDDTYKRFIVNPPPNSKIVKTTWRDNPFFPEVLRAEMEHCRATDPDLFNHIWEGCPVSLLSGAVYADELRKVDAEQRITRVPYDRTRPVDTYWDLGFHDMTAIWFVQSFPFEYRFIDYIESSAKPISYYLDQIQQRRYLQGTDWIPWDVGLHATQMGSGRSIEELMRAAGRKVRIVPKLNVSDGINAARTIFPLCWFDSERCADGIQALRHYRYGEIQTTGQPTREPVHDFASHGSDAFRYCAICAKPPKQKPPATTERPPRAVVSAWS